MDVVSLQKVHEIWVARELVVVIAREERDTDILASPSERLEDARELADEHIELILAFDLGELPEAEGVADDHEFDLLVGLGRERLEKVDQLILEVTDAQRLVPADVQVTDQVERSHCSSPFCHRIILLNSGSKFRLIIQ